MKRCELSFEGWLDPGDVLTNYQQQHCAGHNEHRNCTESTLPAERNVT